MNKTKLSWAIGIIAGLFAIGTQAPDLWHHLGWITPAKAEAEHVASSEAILEAIKQLQKQQNDNHTEWKCDEAEEELQKLRRRIRKIEENTDEYAEIAYDIDRIENKMQKMECSRFEDFG